jgi:hypothetical protein
MCRERQCSDGRRLATALCSQMFTFNWRPQPLLASIWLPRMGKPYRHPCTNPTTDWPQLAACSQLLRTLIHTREIFLHRIYVMPLFGSYFIDVSSSTVQWFTPLLHIQGFLGSILDSGAWYPTKVSRFSQLLRTNDKIKPADSCSSRDRGHKM